LLLVLEAMGKKKAVYPEKSEQRTQNSRDGKKVQMPFLKAPCLEESSRKIAVARAVAGSPRIF